VQTHQIHISNGRDHAPEIRTELLAFSEVLEVFITGRPDALVVVCAGRPHPAEWLGALRAAGYDPLPRRRGTPSVNGRVYPAAVNRLAPIGALGRTPVSASAHPCTEVSSRRHEPS
jgi:hypothetical protein